MMILPHESISIVDMIDANISLIMQQDEYPN